MYPTAEQCAAYEKALHTHLTSSLVMIIFLGVLCIGGIVLLCWWRGIINEESREVESNSDVKAVRKEKIEWYALLVLLLVVFGIVLSSLSGVIKPLSDINDRAYIVVDTKFTVTETDWWGRFNKTTYTITFERNGETVEISPDLSAWSLSPGEYTDMVFVYAEKSEILLDLYSKEDVPKP